MSELPVLNPYHEDYKNKETLRRPTSKIPLLIFTAGPVIDPIQRIRAERAQTPVGQEDVPLVSHRLIKAAVELYNMGDVEEIYIMGGRTGGQNYASESEVMRRKIEELNVPKEIIGNENESIDTPTNLLYFLNDYTKPDAPIDEPTIDVLGATTHIHRIKVMAKIFGIPVRNVFASEEVLRYKARTVDGQPTDDSTQWDNKALQDIQSMLDLNDPRRYTTGLKGVDASSVKSRAMHDNLWVREVLQFPERMPQLISKIENDSRVREMVRIQIAVHGEEAMAKLGIHVDDDITTLRRALSAVPWPIHTEEEKKELIEQWLKDSEGDGWPTEILEKYDRLMSYKSS